MSEKKYKFFIDSKECFLNEEYVTGAVIRSFARAEHPLMVQHVADGDDIHVKDDATFKLSGEVKYFVSFPAQMGG